MNETGTKEKVHAAITNSEYIWRTATGIAAATGLPLEAVMDVLEQADGFLEADSRNSRSKALYTTIDKYHSETPWQRRLLDAMTNSVGI